MDLKCVFERIARDGLVTTAEQLEFEEALSEHADTVREVEVRDKRVVHLFRTGEFDSPWHERLEKEIARCGATQRASNDIH